MKPYKRTFQEYWMNTDSKPKGKDKQMIEQQTRAQLKVATAVEVRDAILNFKPRVPFSYVVAARKAAREK